MKKNLLMLVAGLLCMFRLQAQQVSGFCGVTATDALLLTDRLQENLQNRDNVVTERGAIQYVPVHFHLVGDPLGDGKIKESKVLDQLCTLNEQYADMDIRFYLSPHSAFNSLFNYNINTNNVYNNQSSWLTMHNNRHTKAMNIYVVNDIPASPGTEGDPLAYYNIPRDWIVAKKSVVSRSGKVEVPHEVGHFFSLLHTFNGWESNQFDATDPSWPIAPTLSPDGVPTERADGSNCETAGDYLCDTPADYNLGLGFPDCDYDLGAKDPTGALVDPMEINMMAYFLGCTEEHIFTPEQQDVILSDLASSSRNYLDNNFAPIATAITTPTNLLSSPANGSTTQFYDEVLLEWKPVDGATYYLLEVDIVFDYNTPNSQSHVVTSTSKLITGLLPNRTYYWRVRPFNEYVTCATPRQQSFKTPATSDVREIAGLSAFQIAPNPAQGETTTLFVHAEDNFAANLLVLDVAGRQVYAQTNLEFTSGDATVELPLTGLENGLYFVSLQNGEGRAVRKITVLR